MRPPRILSALAVLFSSFAAPALADDIALPRPRPFIVDGKIAGLPRPRPETLSIQEMKMGMELRTLRSKTNNAPHKVVFKQSVYYACIGDNLQIMAPALVHFNYNAKKLPEERMAAMLNSEQIIQDVLDNAAQDPGVISYATNGTIGRIMASALRRTEVFSSISPLPITYGWSGEIAVASGCGGYHTYRDFTFAKKRESELLARRYL